ncbi:MAG: D-sedoheptulose 7-phosphate isomerase [Candidatus Cloacimonadales bacterium]|nr:D-sedoheptulose 7-phosphate isomerase [Candidatus Cloacimonadales bacterium]
MIEKIKDSLKEATVNFAEFLHEETNAEIIWQVAKAVAETFEKGNKVLICGNGGSSTDAMHFAEECTGRFRQNRKALPAISLTDPSHITCVANDFGFEEIFARGVEAYGKSGDLLIGISTSGNSTNIIRAFQKAKELGLLTFALLGKDGGQIDGICDLQLIAPGKTTDRIQEIHIVVLHIIVETVERILFPENY